MFEFFVIEKFRIFFSSYIAVALEAAPPSADAEEVLKKNFPKKFFKIFRPQP